ncbi:MAG: glycogen synthase [Desulfobacteraceae bacterium]|nr:MAG: glycogen synthase [Desulfobacteraceae bacterium]
MNILYVSPEIAPFAKTGGLADVSGALPRSIKSLGHDIRSVMPKYRSVPDMDMTRLDMAPLRISMHNGIHGAAVWQSEFSGSPVYLIENTEYFNRENFYGIGNWDYPDNLERFVFFCKAAIACCRSVGFAPDIIHCNDWQTAPMAALIRQADSEAAENIFPAPPRPKIVFSIHNMAYQGIFPEHFWPVLTLSRRYYAYDFEFYGQINLMKSAIVFSDAIHTVSPTYAHEIRTTDLGFGLQGALQARQADTFGILNGVDDDDWSPLNDPFTYGLHFSADDLSGKKHIKTRFREEYGLPDAEDKPLMGIVSRLVDQKGIDLVMGCAERILGLDTQIFILGFGEQRYHDFFEWLLSKYPDRVRLYIGFSHELAHKIEAACDMFLMPSRFEPCGLNQIYSLKYGTLPIVRHTGGLADTIQDGRNGFSFHDAHPDVLLDTVARACAVYRNDPEKWKQMMRFAMKQDFSWRHTAELYVDMYRHALSKS